MASFILDRFDGSQTPIEVDHAVTLKQTGLTWVGQYYSKFGEILLENMLHLSENFAGPVPPNSFDDNSATFGNLLGQLWYDTDDQANFNNQTLKVYDGNIRVGTDGWKRLELIIAEDKPSDYTEGEMFYDSDRKTIDVARENRWESLMVELAYDSERLIGIEGQYYMRKDIDQTMNGVLTATHIKPLVHSRYDLGEEDRRWRELFLNVLSTAYSRDLIPLTDKGYDLGEASQQWGNLHVDVVQANSFTDIMPLATETYNIGSPTLKWNEFYLRTAYIDFYSTIIPRNNTQTIGTTTTRWQHGYFNNLNINAATSNFSPRTGENHNLGEIGRRWDELHVNVIKSTRYDTLIPNTTTTTLGTVSEPFNEIHARTIANTKFTGDVNFDIIRNDDSKGLKWSGLDDEHRIYVEEYANASSTRLVIESGTNPQDSTIIKNNGEDVLEVKQDRVEAHKDVQANKKLIVSDGTGVGVSIEYNAGIGSMEFKFI